MIMLCCVSETDSGVFSGEQESSGFCSKVQDFGNLELSPMIMLCCVSEIDCGVFLGKQESSGFCPKVQDLGILNFHP